MGRRGTISYFVRRDVVHNTQSHLNISDNIFEVVVREGAIFGTLLRHGRDTEGGIGVGGGRVGREGRVWIGWD